MSMRTKIFWLIWLIVAIGAIVWAVKASGTPFPTQGSGAAALISPTAPSIHEPTAVVPPTLHIFYFGLKATNAIGISDFSNEAAYTRTNSETYVTLTCDPPVSNNVDGYLLYWGKASGTYTNQSSWGTNRLFTARIVPPMPSNLLVTVTVSNANDMVWSSSLKGPWSRLGSSNFTILNPIGPRYYRGTNRNSKVFISSRMQ